MTEQDYIDAFIEGAVTADKSKVVVFLLSTLYQTRKQCVALQEQIGLMDTVARDSSVEVECRSCEQYYELPCELSEFDPDMSYCGRDHYCTP
ncbi:hypothetical protein vB_PsyM_KIL5_0007 [Pseudomonas phage vB_PsyM_KIL5]|uniref:Uncharacterized protein n=1 Tax=Pseudomonas phage vB_PsyM_KIL5 TaxID=1777070 RepID=A0A142IFA2_9CAUD|nr:hypothetical protein vB_PsyM_KIL5_0007 [Pseudomonas phage vB_PsyM_KIL5]